jgi:hypothetical protein
VNEILGKPVYKINHWEASHGLSGTLELQQLPAINHGHPDNCCVNCFTAKKLYLPSLCSNSLNDGSNPCPTSCLFCNPLSDIKGFELLCCHHPKILFVVVFTGTLRMKVKAVASAS